MSERRWVSREEIAELYEARMWMAVVGMADFQTLRNLQVSINAIRAADGITAQQGLRMIEAIRDAAPPDLPPSAVHPDFDWGLTQLNWPGPRGKK